MSKSSVQKAMEKYLNKNTPKHPRSTKNDHPEKRVVESILNYLSSIGASAHIIEAKAFYSQKADMYFSQAVVPGYSDISGNFNSGLAFFIEAKAPKKLSTIRENQHLFLVDKIKTNAFAVCVDSVELLKTHIEYFNNSLGFDQRQKYLLSQLPNPKSLNSLTTDEPLFD